MLSKIVQNIETFKVENVIVFAPIVTREHPIIIMAMYGNMIEKNVFMHFLITCSLIRAFCLKQSCTPTNPLDRVLSLKTPMKASPENMTTLLKKANIFVTEFINMSSYDVIRSSGVFSTIKIQQYIAIIPELITTQVQTKRDQNRHADVGFNPPLPSQGRCRYKQLLDYRQCKL